MRKILFFMHNFEGTGVTRNAIALANAWACGHTALLAVTRLSGPMRQDVGSAVQVAALLEHGTDGSRPVNLLRSVKPLARLLEREKPDVFFSAGNHGHLTAIMAHLAAGRPCPLVCRFSNDVLRPKLPGIQGWGHKIVEFFAMGFQRLVIRQADKVITVSEELAHRLRLLSPGHADKITTIRNGVDVPPNGDAPPPHPWLTRGNVPVVLGIGRLKTQKNFDGLIRAVALAARIRPLRLLILGEGSAAAQDRLLALAEQTGLAGNFCLAGYQPNPESYLQHADLFVLSSHWEGAPNALLEALAAGIPIVSTREACGAHEILAGGKFGRLVSSLDVPGMAQAILDTLEAVPSPGREPRQSWLQQFTRDQMLNDYLVVLRQTMALAQAPVNRR